jgi:hypothetical protein
MFVFDSKAFEVKRTPTDGLFAGLKYKFALYEGC